MAAVVIDLATKRAEREQKKSAFAGAVNTLTNKLNRFEKKRKAEKARLEAAEKARQLEEAEIDDVEAQEFGQLFDHLVDAAKQMWHWRDPESARELMDIFDACADVIEEMWQEPIFVEKRP